MKLSIYAKNMTVSPQVTRRIEKKTEKMSRYLLPDTEMQIRMRREKNDLRVVEITVPMGNNVILRAEASEPDNLFMAIDQALAKMERQIHRHRTKLGKRIKEDAFIQAEPEYIEEEAMEEDAMIQMEMLGHSFFAFVNLETERTNVLYLRKDGNLGLLEPEA